MRKRKDKKLQLTPRTIVTWVCERDYRLIPVHYAGIRKVSRDAVIYVYDAFAPEGQPEPPAPKVPHGALAVPSRFNRKGNLNGISTITEMLRFYDQLGELGVKKIMKWDVDTIASTLKWDEEGAACGFHGSNGYYWTGICYTLPTVAVKAMLQYIEKHGIKDEGYHLPEDQVMTQLVALVNACKVNIYESGTGWVCAGFMAGLRHNPEAIRVPGVFHCGQWQRLEPLTKAGLDRTDLVLNDMEYVLATLWREKPREYIKADVPEHSWIAARKG